MDLIQALQQALVPSAAAAVPPPIDVPPPVDPNAPSRPGRFAAGRLPAPEPFGGVPIGGTAPPNEAQFPPMAGGDPDPVATRRAPPVALPGTTVTPASPMPPPNDLMAALAKAFGANGPAIAGGGNIPPIAMQPAPAPAPAPGPAPVAGPPADRPAGPPIVPGVDRADATTAPGGINRDAVLSFFRNLTRGAASADPRAPRGTALAQGAAGNLVGSYNEERQARLDKEGRADKAFSQNLATRADSRAERQDVRAERSGELANTRTVQEIMRNATGTLNQADRIKIEQLLNARARALNPGGGIPIDPAKLNSELDAYRQQLERQLTGRNAPTQQSAPTQTPAPTGGNAPARGRAPTEADASLPRPTSEEDVRNLGPGQEFWWDGRIERRSR